MYSELILKIFKNLVCYQDIRAKCKGVLMVFLYLYSAAYVNVYSTWDESSILCALRTPILEA